MLVFIFIFDFIVITIPNYYTIGHYQYDQIEHRDLHAQNCNLYKLVLIFVYYIFLIAF